MSTKVKFADLPPSSSHKPEISTFSRTSFGVEVTRPNHLPFSGWMKEGQFNTSYCSAVTVRQFLFVSTGVSSLLFERQLNHLGCLLQCESRILEFWRPDDPSSAV